jgi:hypothetical protein
MLHVFTELCKKRMTDTDGVRLNFLCELIMLRDNNFTFQPPSADLSRSEIDMLSSYVLSRFMLSLIVTIHFYAAHHV